MATPGLDRHGAYVALSRHRDGVALHYGADDFADRGALDRTLGRERAKDTTLDYGEGGQGGAPGYARTFAERRDIHVPVEMQRAKAPEPDKKSDRWTGFRRALEASASAEAAPEATARTGRFASFRPQASRADAPDPAQARTDEARERLRDYARAWGDAERISDKGLEPPPHQLAAIRQAKAALVKSSPEIAEAARSAFSRTRGLASQVDDPGGLEPCGEGHGKASWRCDGRRSCAPTASWRTWQGLEAQRVPPGRMGAGGRPRRR